MKTAKNSPGTAPVFFAAVALVAGGVGCRTASQEAPPSAEEPIGLNATPTADPAVFTLFRPMRAEGMRVGIVSSDSPDRTEWLDEGTNYTFDADGAKLMLRKGLRVAEGKAFLLVIGIPEPRNVFLFHESLPPGRVRVVVDDREIREGEGFLVEETSGRVTILDSAFARPGSSYTLTAGNVSFGNARR